MILRALELEAFGPFVRATFEFRRGLNLVIGPNEAGKSSMMDAVPAVLFGVRDKGRFVPWTRPGICRACVRFETAEGTVTVQRDLLTDEVSLTWSDHLYQPAHQVAGKASPRGRSGEREAYLNEIERLIGFRDPDLFRSSLFFGQGALSLDFGRSLAERIKDLLSGGGDVNYDQVLTRLRESLFAITAENPWGKDKTRDRRLESARKELVRIREELRRSESALAELTALEAELDALERRIERERSELAKGERYLQWISRYWHLAREKERLTATLDEWQQRRQTLGELLERERELHVELSRRLSLSPAMPFPDEVLRLLEQGTKLARFLPGSLPDRDQERDRRGRLWRRVGLGLGTLLAVGGSLLARHLRPEWGFYPHFAAALLWLFTVFALRLSGRKKTRRQSVASDNLRSSAELHRICRQLSDRLGIDADRLCVLLADGGDAWAELFEQLRQVHAALAVLPDRRQVDVRIRELARELALVEERQSRGRQLRQGVDLQADDLEQAERALEGKRRELEELGERRTRLLERRIGLAAPVADRARLIEREQELSREVAALERKKRILTLACGELQQAVNDFRANYLQRFAERVGGYLHLLTDGRHGKIRLRDDLKIDIMTASGSWKGSEQFSQGTRDTLSLAVRLGLVEQFSRGRHLPLLLDDALVNLDQHRQKLALHLLARLAGRHQVILFSHDERLGRKAAREGWHVITLDRRASAKPQRQEEAHAGQLHLL
ncbi:AAA domain-containing protein [Geothermobacter ehrlichii]|uniref:AAA domain-containing protein n=1 Tax=Geothermobacter ehrlichii TaxID=213224 RepID=A0A5D3WM36_9BACT|nr:AAA family ATPase [Geothermobacter ehrlichii]TYP00236.1 AAA domain-containing protein [Geothermobacter ehrlichii]